ncbi:hypothetical protein AB0D83_35040 [Streptomyces decoyicus]|uniref:hypothetical protein n=1 Tax=Streptomyces decoyicus TaxID=249567 RepID=UPI0033CDC766
MQTLVFPSLGTDHTYPHTSASPRGCATSGLPVGYVIDRSEQPSNCELVPAANPTRIELSGNTGGCTIIASQPGDSTWAAAGSVRQRFRVGWQPISLSWADPPHDMRYPGSASVRIRVQSPDPFDGYISMKASGACAFANDDAANPAVGGRTVITATVVLRDPGPDEKGECTLTGDPVSDHTQSRKLTPRTYRVVGQAGNSSPSVSLSPS